MVQRAPGECRQNGFNTSCWWSAPAIGARILSRVFWGLRDARLVAVCDSDPKRLATIESRYRDVEVTQDFAALITRDDIDAVIIAGTGCPSL